MFQSSTWNKGGAVGSFPFVGFLGGEGQGPGRGRGLGADEVPEPFLKPVSFLSPDFLFGHGWHGEGLPPPSRLGLPRTPPEYIQRVVPRRSFGPSSQGIDPVEPVAIRFERGRGEHREWTLRGVHFH